MQESMRDITSVQSQVLQKKHDTFVFSTQCYYLRTGRERTRQRPNSKTARFAKERLSIFDHHYSQCSKNDVTKLRANTCGTGGGKINWPLYSSFTERSYNLEINVQ